MVGKLKFLPHLIQPSIRSLMHEEVVHLSTQTGQRHLLLQVDQHQTDLLYPAAQTQHKIAFYS